VTSVNDIDRLRGLLGSERINITRLADGSAVVLDLSGTQVLTLNRTGAYLVDQLLVHQASDEQAMVQAMINRFEVEPTVAAADVAEFLAQLASLLQQA